MNDIVVSHWRPGKLPADLVGGLMQDWTGLDTKPPESEEDMRHRILQVVGLRFGLLQDDNFTYRGLSTPTLCRLFIKSLPVAAPILRSLQLRLAKLVPHKESLPNLRRLFESSPLLSSLELTGSHDLDNPASVTESIFVHDLLHCLGFANPPRLQRLQLRGMTAGGDAFATLMQLTSLRMLSVVQCSIEFMDSLFHGLMGHPTLARVSLQSDLTCESLRPFLASLPSLRSFSGDCTIDARMKTALFNNSQMLASLPPLHNLQSLRLGSSVTRLVDGTTLALLLQGMPNLRSLDLQEYSPPTESAADFGTTLTSLQSLRYLTMGRLDAAYLAQCANLTDLSCIFRPSDEVLEVLLATDNDRPHPRITSLEIERWMSDARFCALLQRLEHRETTLDSLIVPQGEAGPSLGQFLQQTLSVNQSLHYLSLPCSESVLMALCSVFQESTTSVASLHLQNIRIDTTPLLVVLKNGCSLCRLSLHYKSLVVEARTSLRECVAFLKLKSLFVHFDGSEGTTGLHPDEFAPTLEQNKTLMAISIHHNAKTQPAWDILTRLVSTRNRIRQMLATDSSVPAEMWPWILESLVPDRSSIFVVVKDLFWPLVHGE